MVGAQENLTRNGVHKQWVLGIATLAVLLSSVSAADTTLALKPLLSEFHAGAPALVWVSLGYLVPFLAVLPVVGKLADTYGHRAVLLWSLAIFTVPSALGLAANNVASMIVLRTITKIDGAGLLVSLASVALSFLERQQGIALGIWRATLLIGTVGGPPLGGLLVATLGWPRSCERMLPSDCSRSFSAGRSCMSHHVSSSG
jgi:MFS family permease